MENNNDDIQAIWWIIGVLIVAGIGAYFLVFREKPKNTTENIPDRVNINNPSIAPKETVPSTSDALPDNKKNMDTNTITTKDGLIITVIKDGSGAVAENGKKVTVHYTGTFSSGKKFDSSVDRGQPFSFTLGGGQVIKGWDQGVLGMKVGEKRKLVIPSDLAYGPNDYSSIPGGSILHFDIELLGVE